MATTNDPQKQATPEETKQGMQDALQDRSRFIRTMAKDMAALAGGGGAAARPTPAPAPKPAAVAGVWLPEREAPMFERPEAKAMTRTEAPVALPSMQEAGAIVSPATEDREAVLERLRQKVSASSGMAIQESPAPAAPAAPTAPAEKSWPEIPTPPANFAEPTPAWQNIPAPQPEFAPLSEPTPTRLPPLMKPASADTYREPVEETSPLPPSAAGPDPLHTFSSDFSKQIDQKGASTFTVLAAEQDQRATAPTALSPQKRGVPKALFAVLTGVLLLVLAGGGVFATYRFVMTMRDTPIAAFTVPSIVHADEYRELSGFGPALLAALADATNGTIVPGNILVTYINTERTDESGVVATGPAGGATFLRTAAVPAPDILLRNVDDASTVGIINIGGTNSPFFALRVDSYERTYAGMLTWEPLMARDLAPLYPLYAAEELPVPVATTTATSTVSLSGEASQGTALTRFSDAIVANRDVRILKDTLGKTLVLYGYADKRTLLIARDEAAFAALLERLKAD